MQAASLPATYGWLWARQGLALFMRQPLAMFTWAMSISLLLVLASVTPPIGPLLFIALMPIVTLMTLSACRQIAQGNPVLPSTWIEPLRQPGVGKRLFGMGALYAGSCVLAGLLAFLPFMGDLAQSVQSSNPTDLTPFLQAMRGPLLVFGVLYVVLAALFWHAPVLAAWHGVRLGQALFFSGIACWRNKFAFVVYGLVWAAAFLVIEFCGKFFEVLGLSAQAASLLQTPLNIAAGGVLYCSFYPVYTTVFGTDGQASDEADEPGEADAPSVADKPDEPDDLGKPDASDKLGEPDPSSGTDKPRGPDQAG